MTSAKISPKAGISSLKRALRADFGPPTQVNARFLIETKHQLAMTYNDRSPLQNMSAAKLFEIMKKCLASHDWAPKACPTWGF